MYCEVQKVEQRNNRIKHNVPKAPDYERENGGEMQLLLDVTNNCYYELVDTSGDIYDR